MAEESTAVSLPTDMAGVADPHPDYVAMRPDLDLVEDLRQGTRQMREKHNVYLPKFANEKEQVYERRWKAATLYNAFEETLGMLVGKSFSKPPALDEKDVPPDVVELAEDVDRAGNHFVIFSEEAFREGLRAGLAHILVDMPPMPTTPEGEPAVTTKAEEKAAGRRPYWVLVQARQVIGWKSEDTSGRKSLTQVRIEEEVDEDDGEFSTKRVRQIRVLEPGRCRVFREGSAGEGWTVHQDYEMVGPDGARLDYIPLVTFYADERAGFMTAVPPLLDLAHKNVEHFQVHSDYRNCMTVACFPVFAVSGWQVDDGELALGPFTVLKMSAPDAKAYYAEHTGAALGAARTYLMDLKEEMSTYGLKMLLPKPGQTATATGEAITEARASSQLHVMALRFRDALEQALEYTARWLGLGEGAGGSVIMDTGGLTLSLQDVDQLLKAGGAPAKPVLPIEVIIAELKRRGFLAEDVDPKEALAMLANQYAQQTPVAGLAGTFLQPPGPAPATVPPRGLQ